MPETKAVRPKEDIQKDLETAEKLLSVGQETLKKNRENLGRAMDNVRALNEEIVEDEMNVSQRTNDVVCLKMDLDSLTKGEGDFDGCPKEWQRQTIVFMRNAPGVDIHFSVLLAGVSENPPDPVFTKARAAMLNLMGHLITKGKVAKGKNGNYKWVVFPKNWKTPSPVISITRLPVGNKVQTLQDPREVIAQEVLVWVKSSGEAGLKEIAQIESWVYDACVRDGINKDLHLSYVQYVEDFLILRGTAPHRELQIFGVPEKPRECVDRKEHLIRAMDGRWAHPGPDWKEILKPGRRQTPVDTRRKGGSR